MQTATRSKRMRLSYQRALCKHQVTQVLEPSSHSRTQIAYHGPRNPLAVGPAAVYLARMSACRLAWKIHEFTNTRNLFICSHTHLGADM